MTNRLPEKLTALRKCYNYSLADVAEKIQVQVPDYMNFENGNTVPNIYVLKNIADLYNVAIEELLLNSREVTLPNTEEIFSSVTLPPFALNGEGETTPTYANAVPIDDEIADGLLYPNIVKEEYVQTEPAWEEKTMEISENLGETKAIPVGMIAAVEKNAQPINHVDENLFQETTVHRVVEDAKPRKKEAVGNRKPASKVKVAKKPTTPWYKKPIVYGILAAAVLLIILIGVVVLNKNKDSAEEDGLMMTDSGRLVISEKFSAYLNENGEVVISGQNPDVTQFRNVVQLAATGSDLVGLKADGTVISTGTGEAALVKDWKDIVAIAAGNNHIVGVKSDGTVECVGSSEACAVSTWTNVDKIFAGGNVTIARTEEGKMLTSGSFNSSGAIATQENVTSVAIGEKEILVVYNDGTVDSFPISSADTTNTRSLETVKSVAVGDTFVAGLTSQRRVSIITEDKDIAETVESWNSVRYIAARGNTLVAIDKNQTIIGVGDNTYGQYSGSKSAEEADKKLESVKNIKFNVSKSNITISWDKVENAEYYEVVINTNPEIKLKSVTNSVSVSSDKLSNNKEYTITVTPYSKDTKMYEDGDPTEVKYTYKAEAVQLAAPGSVKTDLKDTKLTVSWSAVEHADYYNVAIESMVVKVEGTSKELDVNHLTDGKTYTVYVTAMSNDTSKYTESNGASKEFTYNAPKVKVTEPPKKLGSTASVSTMVSDNGEWIITWAPVEGASSYKVTVGASGLNIFDSNVSGSTSITISADKLVDNGIYSINIAALAGANSEKYTNGENAPFTETYTGRPATPEPTAEVIPDPTPEPTNEPIEEPVVEPTEDPGEEGTE